MIVGAILPPGMGSILIAVTIACLTTRWVAPLVLRMLARSIQTAVAMVATLMILPEYYVSSASRRRHLHPPQLAYDYGAAVGWLAFLIHRIVGWLLQNLANTIREIPLALVAIIACGLTVGLLLLNLITA
jgi:hypothetical protein